MEMAQLLQHGRSLTVKIRCHLSRNNSCTDAIFIDHWRAAHKPCKQIHTFMLFCINSEQYQLQYLQLKEFHVCTSATVANKSNDAYENDFLRLPPNSLINETYIGNA